jgi:hypothetical protein
MRCSWEITSYYRRGSEDMNVWTCTHCKKTVWLEESKGRPSTCGFKGEK